MTAAADELVVPLVVASAPLASTLCFLPLPSLSPASSLALFLLALSSLALPAWPGVSGLKPARVMRAPSRSANGVVKKVEASPDGLHSGLPKSSQLVLGPSSLSNAVEEACNATASLPCERSLDLLIHGAAASVAVTMPLKEAERASAASLADVDKGSDPFEAAEAM